MEHEIDLNEALTYIDPAELDYQTWVNVGMALKHEGYSVGVWDDWSRRDINRYHAGECAAKWESFNGSAKPVTGATIVQLAKENGMTFGCGEGRALDWDDYIEYDGSRPQDDHVVVDKKWVEGRELSVPSVWDPARQVITYLETLFEQNENVGYVMKSWERDGKRLPANKGNYDRTAGQLIEELSKCNGDIGAVLGDSDPDGGAWIRFNPLDGKGVKNSNVTEYRYALVESDSIDIERQNAIIRELELPVAVLVYSGGKSLHAIVRIEAANYDEYRKRVDLLYNICQKNGLSPDTQNRNPSRLSRLPGVQRGNSRQYIVDTNIGKSSWNEWREWIEGVNDDLPDTENMAAAWDALPELAPPLIDGVLRQGHKMRIAGPSKAGKSFSLIEMCCAFAEGASWLGWKCAQGKVLYVNLELDRASCLHRFKDVYTALGLPPNNLENIDIWNLRGRSVPMDKLAPKLIRRAAKKNYIAVIVDPIYKVITGDENSADQMAHFCNQFDKVCTELGCAVIYCHHHSKGAQGGKRSMDRASGSGVFARDPDALLDLIELDIPETLLKEEKNKAICNICYDALMRNGYSDVSQDDMVTARAMLEHAEKHLPADALAEVKQRIAAAEKAAESRTAWRIEGTLREFPKFSPVNVWFDFPVHRIDMVGVLRDVDAESERAPWQKASEKRKDQAKKQNDSNKVKFENAMITANFGEAPTVEMLVDYLSVSERTIKRWIEKFGYRVDKNTMAVLKNDNGTT
ncbi:MAG: DNA primase [Ruminococcaceae bacterium]|nr:DNA primase [Oscillospiraceae bacterium]